jgi:NADH-quinone oxidoreductase subunit J
LESVVFYFLSGVSVAMALVVAGSRRPIYAVLALVGCFCAVAGLFGLLGATVLAAVQIVIAAGAVGVVFLLVVVLLDASGETSSRAGRGGLRWGGWGAAVLGVILFGLIAASVFDASGVTSAPVFELGGGSAMALGKLLLTSFVVPFTAIAAVVLASLVGAAWLARR